VFRIKYEEVFSYKPNADTSHLLDSLVSALAVYATAFRSKLSLNAHVRCGRFFWHALIQHPNSQQNLSRLCLVPAPQSSKNTNLVTTCGHPTCGVTYTPDTDLHLMFRRGTDYVTRCAIVRTKASQIPRHIHCLWIMPSATPSFESGHFRKDALLAVVRLICKTHSGISATTTIYV